MKILFAMLLAQTIGFSYIQAQTSKPVPVKKTLAQRTCERLFQQAETECAEAMCGEYTEETGEECVQDGDFAEGHQICVTEGAFPSLVEGYNKRNPKKKINCDDME